MKKFKVKNSKKAASSCHSEEVATRPKNLKVDPSWRHGAPQGDREWIL